MARRRAKRSVKRVGSPPPGTSSNGLEGKEAENDKREAQFADPDVEHLSAAVRAMRDVEIEHLLTELRLYRSHFDKEQLQTPLLHFLQEILPSLSVARNGLTKVQWTNKNGKVIMKSGSDLLGCLLHQLSIACSDCSAFTPSLDGLEFSSKAVKEGLLGTVYPHIMEFVSSQRPSSGRTPKKPRLPKPGEKLLSVHGSPLGVYKDDSTEAIQEKEEGRLGSNHSE